MLAQWYELILLYYSYIRSPTFKDVPHYIKTFKNRKNKLINEINKYNCDLLCLQEVDNYEECWKKAFTTKGFSSQYISYFSLFFIIISLIICN